MPAWSLGGSLALCAAGPWLLRHGWQRSSAPVIAGWVALAGASLVLSSLHGAWGLATGATVAIASAASLLIHAALATPGPGREIPERIAAPLPPAGIDRHDLARRLSVFTVVVVLDLGASLWLGWSVQRACFRLGMGEANTTALALFLFPLLWLAAASWQMTCARLAAMIAPPLFGLVAGGVLWLAI